MAEEKRYVEVLLPLKLKETLTYRLPAGWMAEAGTWVQVPLRGHPALGVVTAVHGSAPVGLPLSAIGVVEAVPEAPGVGVDELAFWQTLADYYLCTPGEVFRAAYNAGLQRAVLNAGTPRRKARRKNAAPKESIADFPLKTLSEAQQRALGQMRDGFARHKPVLLFGATGSGKTELYLQLAAENLLAGRDVLFLVPEIAMSKQLQQRLEAVFGPSLLVFHSKTTVSQRYAVIDTLRRDPTPRIVLGTRSAVFLPFRNLGLAVVDEEHDRSYKQDDTAPRYNGRDAALMLAARQKADIVLGSATPSCEALYNVETRKFARADLPERYHGGENAAVEIVVGTDRALHGPGAGEGAYTVVASGWDHPMQLRLDNRVNRDIPYISSDFGDFTPYCREMNRWKLEYTAANNTMTLYFWDVQGNFFTFVGSVKLGAYDITFTNLFGRSSEGGTVNFAGEMDYLKITYSKQLS